MPQRLIQSCLIFDQLKRINYKLANLLFYGWLLLATEEWFDQTDYVSYTIKTDTNLFYHLTSQKTDTLC